MRRIIFVGGDKQASMIIFNWRGLPEAQFKPAKSILSLCTFYETSERLAGMARQGNYSDVQRYKKQEAVFRLVEGDPQVLGLQHIVPTEICKYKPLYQPENIKNKEYVEGVNWLRKFIEDNKSNGICDDYSRLFIYKGLIPEIIRTDVTEEDVYGDEVN